ncbi:hypothetical protein [Serpentinicella alkaliphila]|nr:hypothetical protein [Serpentinicella alkaliphila]
MLVLRVDPLNKLYLNSYNNWSDNGTKVKRLLIVYLKLYSRRTG